MNQPHKFIICDGKNLMDWFSQVPIRNKSISGSCFGQQQQKIPEICREKRTELKRMKSICFIK